MTNGENRTENTIEDRIQRIRKVSEISEELQAEFDNENWEKVENLLERRNQAANEAFGKDLPADTHEYARQVFESLRQQDKDLMARATELKDLSRQELMQRKKSKQSIAAYQTEER